VIYQSLFEQSDWSECSLVSIGGRGREGLVSTACTCTVVIQILNNPITYGYFLVYLPFDVLNIPGNGKLGQFNFRARFRVTSRDVATSIDEGVRTVWECV
jgi:hypothetical protein